VTGIAPPDCTCGLQPPRCDACFESALLYLRSTVWARGEAWANGVAASGTAAAWPRYEGDAVATAHRLVADLEPRDERIADALARECHAWAAHRWARIQKQPAR
jgi:hypothetical protein